MSRSLHTRPTKIRAADRLRAPRKPRRAKDPSRRRRLARELKELGIPVDPGAARSHDDWELPRITRTRPRPGYHHPADVTDVAEVLRFFGEECVYGLQAIELRQGEPTGALQLGRLVVPGRIVLYDQLPSPWRLPGRLEDDDLDRLRQAGARTHPVSDEVVEVSWPGSTLGEFMLLDVLMHEVGHHLLQHHKGKRPVRIARTRDHEAFADAFARRCREAYLSCVRS